MTPEGLEDAILRGDRHRCLALLSGAPETERRAAAPVAIRWFCAAHDLRSGNVTEDAAVLARSDSGPDEIHMAADVATLGTASLTELKGLKGRALLFNRPAWEALADRKPSWLAEWCRWVLAQGRWSWHQVRQLVRAGLIPRPEEDAYITALIGHLGKSSALELLRNDPGLLEHEVWRLFEIEGGGEDSLAARDKYARGDYSWGYALKTLADEGLLDRSRLLDASLGALDRDFGQFRAGWFSAFHESLSPTLEERTARRSRYLALLGSRIPPTVSFGLKALALLDKADRLPGDELVGHVAAALGAREKGTVTLALKLLDRAVQRDAALAGPAASVASEALLHEKPEAQGAALALIERHGRQDDRALAELVRSRLEDLAPSQRQRAEAWLGDAAAPIAPASVTGDEALVARAQALPERWRRAAGVDAALALLRGETSAIPPVALEFGRYPILDPAARIAPVETLDELIDVCAAVLENLGPSDEIERMLDGMSRLCGARPDDFERRTAPLAKRAGSLVKRYEHTPPYVGFIYRDLPDLIRAWTRGVVTARGSGKADLWCFHGHRMLEVARRAAAGEPARLLAAPTHPGAWIDPRVFVQRLLDLKARGVPLLPYDTIQALLRLAPDHRADALVSAAALTGEVGDAARYALGAAGIRIGRTAALWVAAARSRSPGADYPELEARHPAMGPDAAIAARALLHIERAVHRYGGREHPYFKREVKVEPPAPSQVPEDLPTVLLHTLPRFESDAVTARRWLALTWPASREAWFEEGVRRLVRNLDWVEAEWQNRVHLEALLEPDTPLGPMGLTLLGLGLAAKEAGEAGLATDAAIAALVDGRLTGPLLGKTLASLLNLGSEPLASEVKPGGIITASRWAKTLAVVAHASVLHAHAVHVALEQTLAAHPSLRPADLATLLELMHELSVQLGAAIGDPEARRYLEAQQGGGKGSKLARALLALRAVEQPAAGREVARLALEGRVERAERWSAIASLA